MTADSPAGPVRSGSAPSAIFERLLAEARDVGFLGPGPVATHLDHSSALAEVVEAARVGGSTGVDPSATAPRAVADLGAGGGVPGLLLALRWGAATVLLVESRVRPAAFLGRAVVELGLEGRVAVAAERAELLGRTGSRRGAFDLVTARGFGPPGVTAECAAPLLEVGGLLVVSEPPLEGSDVARRWSVQGLAQLGMGSVAAVGSAAGYRFAVVRQERACPDRFPRRVGVPAKRPLF